MCATTVSEKMARRASIKTYGLRLLKDYAILTALILAIFVLAIVEPAFLTPRNMRNLLDQNAGVGIIACGMTFVIIARGFDLSVSATFALAGIASALVANATTPALGLLAGLMFGTVIGLANGVLIARLQLNSFLITLASSIVIRGLGIAISGGYLISVTEQSYSGLGLGGIYGITYPIIIFIAFVIVSLLALHCTQYGRYIFAVGGNEEAALLSGVRTKVIKGSTFAVAGFAAALAGILLSSKVSTGIPNSGAGLELQAIAAVVLGGTSIAGGAGAIWRTVVGVFLLAIINNAFNIMNLEAYLRDMMTGTIIILAVATNTLTGRK
ncbi:ABC transporter permease [Mesorhizobium sp. M4A.F.Ca.ET.022.05.2.1]|uniref:ABC transporter permease n=1 Tax=Mesorhizobium sp. M4A.F.Ca.ET.022.05.2.1 TaxID=2496653 RepID=UPI000FC9EA2B|nr:ABC transporter permease [Mesorhizobium sp. M4A.F.Ca.ET.022.05.2.1]RVC82572.1 ABC transporter permease [Mesorhizobium sp. M4A.F.Ca.ET.022.05.2.1]